MIDCSKTENYFIEKLRMTGRTREEGCKIKCSECPLSGQNNGTTECMSCITFEILCPEKAIKVVQRWSDDHPQRTYLTEFLKHYPNALLKNNGTPEICLSSLGLTNYNGCRNGITCLECWNQPIENGESK